MLPWPAYVALAFLSGSVPFGFLIGRANGVDLRTVGSKNIGATNLGRVLGRRYFFLCFFLDMLKGLVPTALAGWSTGTLGRFAVPDADAWWWLAVMAAAVLGHMFTPWLGFKGGKGVATGLGAMLGVFPALTVPALGATAVFLVVLGMWRYVSAASVTAAIVLPLFTGLAHNQYRTLEERRLQAQPQFASLSADELDRVVQFRGWAFVIVAGALAALVVWKHRANLSRLAAGTEPRIGQRASTTRPDEPGAGDPPVGRADGLTES